MIIFWNIIMKYLILLVLVSLRPFQLELGGNYWVLTKIIGSFQCNTSIGEANHIPDEARRKLSGPGIAYQYYTAILHISSAHWRLSNKPESLVSDSWTKSSSNNSLLHCRAHQLWNYKQYEVLWRITLLVQTLCITVGGNLCQCQCQYKAHENIKKTSRESVTRFIGRQSLLFTPGQLSFSGVLIFPMAPKAMGRISNDHIQLWANTVCKLPSQSRQSTSGL